MSLNMRSCPILDRFETINTHPVLWALCYCVVTCSIQSVKTEIKVITTTRVFCSFYQTNIREYPNSGQSDLQPYHPCGPPGIHPRDPLTAHTPRQPTIYVEKVFSCRASRTVVTSFCMQLLMVRVWTGDGWWGRDIYCTVREGCKRKVNRYQLPE